MTLGVRVRQPIWVERHYPINFARDEGATTLLVRFLTGAALFTGRANLATAEKSHSRVETAPRWRLGFGYDFPSGSLFGRTQENGG